MRGLTCVLLCLVAGSLAHAASAAEPEEVSFAGGGAALHGFIFRPAGDGPFPAVLYNHGSEKLPGTKPEIGGFFARSGYVLFVPHRRGQGRSQEQGTYIMDAIRSAPAAFRDARLVELQEQHLADVLAALAYLQGLPFVDKSRIAVAGCSFGGIQTMLAAQKPAGLRAAVAFAPGAMTWASSPALRSRLTEAAREAAIPVLLIQAQNDYDLTPTQVLSEEMARAGRPHQRVILPAYGTTRADGHGRFCFSGVDAWGPQVLAFLAATMKEK